MDLGTDAQIPSDFSFRALLAIRFSWENQFDSVIQLGNSSVVCFGGFKNVRRCESIRLAIAK